MICVQNCYFLIDKGINEHWVLITVESLSIFLKPFANVKLGRHLIYILTKASQLGNNFHKSDCFDFMLNFFSESDELYFDSDSCMDLLSEFLLT